MTDKCIITKSGKRIPEYILKPNQLLDRLMVIYGKSNSGKSVIIKNLMKILKDDIPLAFVISPTEPSNEAYKGFVDKTLIHYDLKCKRGEEDFLSNLLQWQEARSALYTKTNDIEVIKQLYQRIRSDEIDKTIAKIEKTRKDTVAATPFSRHDDTNKMCDEFITKLLKKHIYNSRAKLRKYKTMMSDEEIYTLEYIDLDPRVLLIFDDCAADLKPHAKKESFRKLFYQSRHSYITAIISAQDDTDLPTNLRKNVSVNFFTQSAVAKSNFERASNGYSKDTQQLANAACADIFTGHRKMVYIDNDPDKNNFYHFTATLTQPFMFGSSSLHKICDAVRGREGSIDRNNRYHNAFKLPTKKK